MTRGNVLVRFEFDVLLPGIGLQFAVPDSFYVYADKYTDGVRGELELWLRERFAALGIPPELLAALAAQPLVEVSWEEGSLAVKILLTPVCALALLIGCAAPDRPSYRQETRTVLQHIEQTAVARLGDDNRGFIVPPQVHEGRIAEIDLVIERWQRGEVEAREVAETISSVLDELRARPDGAPLFVQTATYISQRHTRAITKLSGEVEWEKTEITYEAFVELVVVPDPGVKASEIERVINEPPTSPPPPLPPLVMTQKPPVITAEPDGTVVVVVKWVVGGIKEYGSLFGGIAAVAATVGWIYRLIKARVEGKGGGGGGGKGKGKVKRARTQPYDLQPNP